MSPFAPLNLSATIQSTLAKIGYLEPTPIQIQAIPPVLLGRDLLGIAQTGTGKTAAFALPILDLLAKKKSLAQNRPIRCLILTPTRELAAQVGESIHELGKNLRLVHTVIFGGVGQNPQVRALQRGVDILVATPGRLLDLKNQGHVRLGHTEIFVLDEADRMLDMGFIHDIRKVSAALPKKRQTLLFSATMPTEIASLAASLLHDPLEVAVTARTTLVEGINQKVLLVEKADKPQLLKHCLEQENIERALVFTRTKHGADRLAKGLTKQSVQVEAIHGNKSQNARTEALRKFKTGQIRVLVATDIAARGIDIREISHVINFDMPLEPENYIHRVGRTARAGRTGVAISFCDTSERKYLTAIERILRSKVPLDLNHPFHCAQEAPTPSVPPSPQKKKFATHAKRRRRSLSRTESGRPASGKSLPTPPG
ncbi:MAG: DEAD/DEAH box helicase [Magnetococcales bacterium]|nr:DEAD/DEAH box helicase [Magnetococcales bacterium]